MMIETDLLIEILAVASGVIAIFLASRENWLTFLIGLLNAGSFTVFFYLKHLYSASAEHFVYFVIDLFGILAWLGIFNRWRKGKKEEPQVTRLSVPQNALLLAIVTVAGVALGAAMTYMSSQFQEYIPDVRYPCCDAILTAGCVMAQILLVKKKIDTWWWWIVIDILKCVMYVAMWLETGESILMTALLHIIYIGIAISAIIHWKHKLNKEQTLQ